MKTTTTSKKITMATVKAFVKKNINQLHVKCCSRFDGMVDCVMPNQDAGFNLVDPAMIKVMRFLGVQWTNILTKKKYLDL